MHGLILSSISLAGNFHQSESLNLIFYLPSPFYHFTILLPITYVCGQMSNYHNINTLSDHRILA